MNTRSCRSSTDNRGENSRVLNGCRTKGTREVFVFTICPLTPHGCRWPLAWGGEGWACFDRINYCYPCALSSSSSASPSPHRERWIIEWSLTEGGVYFYPLVVQFNFASRTAHDACISWIQWEKEGEHAKSIVIAPYVVRYIIIGWIFYYYYSIIVFVCVWLLCEESVGLGGFPAKCMYMVGMLYMVFMSKLKCLECVVFEDR